MKDIQECLKSDDDITKSAKEIADEISNKRLDLVELVEKLGPTLTSKDPDERARATKLLSETLENLAKDFLTEIQLNFIVTFYCDRLKDHHNVLPSTLSGVLAIVRMKNLPEGCSVKLLQALFHNVPCQSQVRNDRDKFFNIIISLSETKTQELLAMGADFVYGFISSMDGERDPKMLYYLFDFIPKFLKTFPLGHLTDEMFEVIACYFPIDFNPMANDPENITRNGLADKLSDCLCAREEFAEECINLLAEKLESQLNVAKLDSLFVLSKCATRFPPKVIDEQFPTIWKAIQAEILPGSDKAVTLAALDALQTLLFSIGGDEVATRNVLSVILNAVASPLSDTDHRLFMPSIAIVLKCASPNKITAKTVTLKCLPAFLLQVNKENPTRQIQRGTVIDISAALIATCIQNEVINEIDSKLLDTAQTDFIDCFDLNAEENVLSSEALVNIAFNALASCTEIVDSSRRLVVYQAIKKYLVESNGDHEQAIASALFAFAKKYPDEVSTEILRPLFDLNLITQKLTLDTISELFETLCCLVSIRKFRKDIFEFLFKYTFDEEESAKLEYVLIAMKTLHHLLEDDRNEEIPLELYADYHVLDRFITLIHSKIMSPSPEGAHNITDDILYKMSQIIRLIVKALDAKMQKELVEKYLPTVNLKLKADLYFTVGLLGYLEGSVDLENHFEHLVDELTQLSLHSTDTEITDLSNKLLCSLFNKCPDNEHHRNILRRIIEIIQSEIEKHNKKAVEILSYISKGLLSRGHTKASELIDTLIELLEHPTLSEAAVAAFEVISIEFPELHLPAIKHFFQQKLFQWVMKKLWHKVENFSEKHLSALIFVLKLTPHQALKNNIEKVGPILLKSLDLQSSTPLLAALNMSNRFLNDQDDFFRDHLQSLIQSCLKSTTFQDSMKVRIAAIHCLSAMCKYPTFILLPYVQDVAIGLGPALDDNKRLVRNAAVLARNQWYLIGSGN